MQLTQLNKDEYGKITDLSGVNAVIQQRLNQFGIIQNTTICIKNKLPFGGPCMIDCGGQCISIRKKEAENIKVEKL